MYSSNSNNNDLSNQQHINFFDNDDFNSIPDDGFSKNNDYSDVPPPPIDDLPAPPVADLSFLKDTSQPGGQLTHRLDFTQPDTEQYIIMDGDLIKAATFSKLIEQLTRTSSNVSNLLKDFLLTYRSFATSFDVLEGLSKRLETAKESEKKHVSLRVFNVFKHWIDNAWHDFEKDFPELYDRTIAFFDRCIQDETLKTVALGLKTRLERRKNGEDKVTQGPIKSMSRPILPKDPTCDALEIHSEEIARQLTIAEWEIWASIQPWECLSNAWMKDDKYEKAPNVIKMIERFNWVSGWVASTICTIESTKKRTKAINKFIEIADKCLAWNNFNAVMEIVSGLNRGPVYRLKQSWDGVPSNLKKTFEELKAITDHNKSYLNMRNKMKKANPPLLPYLGMYLTDLTFIDVGNADNIKDLINFYKRHLISERIRSIQQYQLKPYNIEKVEFIQEKLRNVEIYEEDQLYELSEYLEPRAGKERGPRPSILDGGKKKEEENFITIDLEDVNGQPYAVPDSSSNIVFHDDGTVKHGTVQKIIEYLTHHVKVDVEGVSAFFLTYHSFATPEEVFNLLVHRFNIPLPKDKSPQNMETYRNEMQTKIYLRVFIALKTWIERSYSDFKNNPELKQKLLDFINNQMSKENSKFAQTLLASINKQEQPPVSTVPSAPPPTPIVPDSLVDIQTATVFDFNSEELARQMCLYHQKFFMAIKPGEMLGKSYKQQNKETLAPNLIKLLESGSIIKSWVDNEVARSEDKISVITKFMEISEKCLTMQNLHAAKSITLAVSDVFNKKNISGGITMDQLPPETKTKIQQDLELYKSAKNLKTKVDSLSPPCVPTIESYLQEISHFEESCGADVFPDKKINFEKKKLCAEPIKRLTERQKLPYNFIEVSLIQQYLTNIQIDLQRSDSFGSFSYKNSFSHSPNSTYSPQLTFFMIDLLNHDEEFKSTVQNMALETFRLEADRIKEEFKLVLQGNEPKEPFTIKTTSPRSKVTITSPHQPSQQSQENSHGTPTTSGTSTPIPMPTRIPILPSTSQLSQSPQLTRSPLSNSGNDSRQDQTSTQSPMNSPILPRNIPKSSPTNVKILPPLQSRGSFTSASKQPGMKDLIASLGKSSSGTLVSSSSTSNIPLTNSFQPMSFHTRSHSSSPLRSSLDSPLNNYNEVMNSPTQEMKITITQPNTPTSNSSHINTNNNTPQQQPQTPQQQPQTSQQPQTPQTPQQPQTSQQQPQMPQQQPQTPQQQPQTPQQQPQTPQQQPQIPQQQPQIPQQQPQTPQQQPQTQIPKSTSTPLIQNFPSNNKSLHELEKEIINKDFPGCELELWEYYDEKGVVYGEPKMISMHILKKDRVYIVCTREHIELSNISELITNGKFYKYCNPNVQLACLVISRSLSPEAEEMASKAKIKVYRLTN